MRLAVATLYLLLLMGGGVGVHYVFGTIFSLLLMREGCKGSAMSVLLNYRSALPGVKFSSHQEFLVSESPVFSELY